jgi:hypothetical protein
MVLGEGEDRAANLGEPWEVGGISGRGIWIDGKLIWGRWGMGCEGRRGRGRFRGRGRLAEGVPGGQIL